MQQATIFPQTSTESAFLLAHFLFPSYLSCISFEFNTTFLDFSEVYFKKRMAFFN